MGPYADTEEPSRSTSLGGRFSTETLPSNWFAQRQQKYLSSFGLGGRANEWEGEKTSLDQHPKDP